MKKIISSVISLFLLFLFTVPSFGVESKYLIDDADILSEEEESYLLAEIEEFINKNGFDVVIHTTDSTQGKEVYEYADDFYDNGEYSEDGLIFVISMEFRDYYTSTSGRFVDELPSYSIDQICESVVPCLSDGEYYKAFSVYLNNLDNHINGLSYNDSFVFAGDYYVDDNNYEDEYYYNNTSSSSNLFTKELIVTAIAVLIAVIITSILKSKMNTAVKKHQADDYIVPGSFNVELSRDLFIGSYVTKRPLPKNNNSNNNRSGGVRMSSGGVRHGGSGGKF